MSLDVLILPSFYSYPGGEHVGSFFREQAIAVARAGAATGVAFVEPRSLKDLSFKSLLHSHWQTVCHDDQGVWTLRQKGWNTGLRTVWGSRLWAQLLTRLVLRNFSKENRPAVLHAHNALYAGLVAKTLAQQFKIPYIITEHSSGFLENSHSPAEIRVVKEAYEGASTIIAVSKKLAKAVADYCPGKEVLVIPNAVDTEFFARRRPRAKRDGFRVLAAGNLTVNKGYDLLIKAFAANFKGRSDCRLAIAGTGPERARLEQLCYSVGINQQTEFLGQLTREQLRDAMWEASIFVIASYHETFGMVAVEAIAAGLPVIATRCGGPEDIITPETGWLIERGSVEALSSSLLIAHASRDKMPILPSGITKRYSMSTVGSSLVEVYREVICAAEGKLNAIRA